MMVATGLLVIVAGLFSNTLAAEPSEAVHMRAKEIVDRAIARSDAQHEELASTRFGSRQTSREESLAADGKVAQSETLIYRQYPLEGAVYGELIQKDGRPLTDKEKREEEKRRAKFVQEVRKRQARGEHPQPEEGPGIRFNHELMDRYRVEVTGTETIRNHECWLISFEPLQGKLPSRTRMDPALNNSTGRLWISQRDYGLVRLEFVMREPFRYWGGLLATIHQAEGRLEFDRIAFDTWLPLNFEFKLDLEVLKIRHIRRRFTRTWEDYQPAEAVSLERTPARRGA